MEWIKVTQRLPNTYGRYLCYALVEIASGMYEKVIVESIFDPEIGWALLFAKMRKVMYWTEMPEKPKD